MAALMIASTSQGVVVLRSEDHGSWEQTAHGLKDWQIMEVAVSPLAPGRLYAGTRGDGVWLSNDYGQTWAKPNYGKPGPGKVQCLTVHPEDPDMVYAGGEPIDTYVTKDAGRNWQRLESVWEMPTIATIDYPVSTVEPHVRDITLDPKDPRKISLALQVGFMLRSDDEGCTWRLQDRNIDSDVHTIVIDPQDTGTLYIATGGHDARLGTAPGRALYKSNDSGDSWQPIALEFEKEYSVPLTMHPRKSSVLYSAVAHGNPGSWQRRPTGAESSMIRSTDGGETWHELQDGLAEASKDFPQAIIVDQTNPDQLYMGTRRGQVFTSGNGGESWSKQDVQLQSIQDLKVVQI